MIGHVPGQPLHPIRRVLTKVPGQYLPRFLIFVSQLYWIRVERPEVDYSKYLGPDWSPTYEGASTYVVNHSSWMVSLCFLMIYSLYYTTFLQRKLC